MTPTSNINNESFYSLWPEHSNEVLHFKHLLAEKIDSYALLRSEWKPQAAIPFVAVSGTKACDLMGTSSFYILLVSAATVNCLRQCGATGWDLFDVSLRRNKLPIEGYHGLSVSGRCGKLDWSRAREAREDEFVLPGARVGIYFDEQTWDGSDVFMPEDTAHVLITPKVRVALQRASLTNMSVVPRGEVVLPAL